MPDITRPLPPSRTGMAAHSATIFLIRSASGLRGRDAFHRLFATLVFHASASVAICGQQHVQSVFARASLAGPRSAGGLLDRASQSDETGFAAVRYAPASARNKGPWRFELSRGDLRAAWNSDVFRNCMMLVAFADVAPRVLTGCLSYSSFVRPPVSKRLAISVQGYSLHIVAGF